MKKISVILFLALLPLFAFSNTDNTDIKGLWLSNNGRLKVRIYEEDNKFYGKVEWQSTEASHKLKKGAIILKDLRYNEKKEKYTGGHFIYNDKKVKCDASLMSNGKLEINVKVAGLKRSNYWTKC